MNHSTIQVAYAESITTCHPSRQNTNGLGREKNNVLTQAYQDVPKPLLNTGPSIRLQVA